MFRFCLFFIFYSLLLSGSIILEAQESLSKKALFIGNSYTTSNNLPKIVAEIAASTGDELIYDANTPGGYTFEKHTTNLATLEKIEAGDWDYVVLQEQSQIPSFPINQVESMSFPFGKTLHDLVKENNECGETVFYMTWGRKNGDAVNCENWPPVCTYEGMDSLLRLRYTMMAQNNETLLSPVGAVWRYIRENYPAMNLYSGDGSHPSKLGSYAAACCFYTRLFGKDPDLITYTFDLSEEEVNAVKEAVKMVVYDDLGAWDFRNLELSTAEINTTCYSGLVCEFSVINTDAAMSYHWDFGDGTTSNEKEPSHEYPEAGYYTITLSLIDECDNQVQITQEVYAMGSTSIDDKLLQKEIQYIPHPSSNQIELLSGAFVEQSYLIKLYNLSGKLIANHTTHPAKSQFISLPENSGSLFLISVENQEKILATYKVFLGN